MALTRGKNASGSGYECAVSEIIGAIMLISIVVVAVAIIGVAITSQPPPQKIPAVNAVISSIGNTIHIYNGGGDSLQKGQFEIHLDGSSTNSNSLFSNDGNSAWTSWSIGQSLDYTVPTGQPIPGKVQIMYTGTGSATIIASADFNARTATYVPTSTSTVTATATVTSTATATATTTIVTPPVAGFTGTPTTGTLPLTVTFTDTSSNTPTSWAWTFGDGSTTNNSVKNPVHTYASAGTYSVTLTATNAGGSSTPYTRTNYITVSPPAPVADFTGTPATGTLPLTVTFTDTSSNTPTSWAWTFGDGSTTNNSVKNPVHTYAGAGTYSVSLTATNAGGSNSVTKTGYITVTTPVSGSGNVILNSNVRGGYIEPNSYMQFRVDGQYSWIILGGTTYDIPVGTTVKLVWGNSGTGVIYSSGSSFTAMTFDGISLYENGAFVGTGSVSGIQANSYSQYVSAMTLTMPASSSQYTSLNVGGTSVIEGNDARKIQIFGLNSAMNLNPCTSTAVYYSGGAASYLVG
jgi:PKD repeat protein